MDLPVRQIMQSLNDYQQDSTRTVSIVRDEPGVNTKLWQKTQKYRDYGYTSANTKIWKTTSIEPKLTFDWEDQICRQLPLKHAIATVTRQDPGQILPWHQDEFFYHKSQFPEYSNSVWRFLVFLSDWKIGHFIQANQTIYHHWKFGDTIVWKPETMHLSANTGLETKWTCNVTGILTL
jgi:hypothetical protein